MPTQPDTRENEDVGNGPPISKRRRISVACNPCRARKSRCSGEHPCFTCIQLGVSCQYQRTTPQSDSVVLPNDVVFDLQERLKAIENLVQSRTGGSSVSSYPLTPYSNLTALTSDRHVDMDNASRGRPGGHAAEYRASGHCDSQPVARLSSEPEVGNSMNGMSISLSEMSPSAFFGPSSNTVFLRQIQNLARNITIPSITDCIKRGAITVTPPMGRVRETLSDQIKEIDELMLPPQWVVESLIDEYFTHATLFFPYLHEHTFRSTYEELRDSGFRSARRSWLALLNMILAISSKLPPSLTRPLSEAAQESKFYYLRAVKLCNDYMFCATSVEMVQCLLLMAWYLQSTQDSSRTWFIHGIAVKAAISLGFHLNGTMNEPLTEREETKLRVWHGCILLDRMLGISFGRPWAIPKSPSPPRLPSQFLAPCTVDIKVLEALQAEKIGSLFLAETTGLSDITVGIISDLYGDNLGVSQVEPSKKILSKVFSLVQRLETWWANVHHSVRWHPNRTVDNNLESRMLNLVKTMLKLDFLNSQLLLYRPVIFVASRIQTSTEDQQHALFPKMISICVRKAFQCACLLISLIHDFQRSRGPLGGPPWFALHQTFHAALSAFSILLLAPEFLPTPLHQSLFVLERAAQVMERLDIDTSHKMGHACAKYIRMLLASLRETYQAQSTGIARRTDVAPPIPPEALQSSTQSFQMPTNLDFAPYDLSEINLAQFFSQEQTDYFGLDSLENGLIGAGDGSFGSPSRRGQAHEET